MKGENDTNEGGGTNSGLFATLLRRDGFSPGEASVVGPDHQIRNWTHRFLGKSTSNPFFIARW